MIERLQELASIHALGASTSEELGEAERTGRSDSEFRQLVDELHEVAGNLALAVSPRVAGPSAEVRERVMERIGSRPERLVEPAAPGIRLESGEALVIADPEGRVQWVNDAFTALCGYSIEELRGRKPGALLQGPLTDAGVARRMSQSIRKAEFCVEEILNYHKDGSPYWVEVTITPILDSSRHPRGFMALERRIGDRPVPVG